MWGSDPTCAPARRLRRGLLGLSLAALVALPLAGEAAAAPGSSGSSGSTGSTGSSEDSGSAGSLGSASNAGSAATAGSSTGSGENGGSVSAGSVIPGPLQNERPPLPPLRDDITVAAIVGEEQKTEQMVRFTVASPALRREVGVEVLLPKDNSVPRPSIYALEGVDAGEDTSGWATIGGAPAFFADKNVNVVMINGGVSGLYTDWDRVDSGVGLHKWETFITEELPPLLDTRLHTNGDKSLLGISMGSQGAMMLAHRNPGMYRGIAVFSGCYSTTDDLGRASVQATVSSRGGDPGNLWGEVGGPEWAAHDTVRNAEQLRGMDIYVSVSTGIPGKYEELGSPDFVDRVFIGGPMEAVANACTHRLDAQLDKLKIPATFDYEAVGIHGWSYWRDRLPKAWPTLARSLDLPA
ncbi:S-formylglutathione hydrolase FrmB [Rhodococcus sp. AG1013]|uniref:alpha/beta hydrolase n=1 Tax=Rhodococcus sp. AG1013 TaxID=2183996 RepID=UPI000E0B0765|nr:alpha/beta hydrolase family protein [Rhodococcus sp. AG1013]RDI19410.1 S-formylglutathione hydrolase FrmB [Rhodococcus sp. AG1013]